MLTHSNMNVDANLEAQKHLEALLNEGIVENSDKNYAEAHDLLTLAYDYSKGFEAKLRGATEGATNIDEKQQYSDHKQFLTQIHMDAAYFLGTNYLAQKSYKRAERLFYEAWLYASLTLKDAGISAAATLYRGICLSRLYENDVFTNDAETIYKAQKLLTSAIKQLETLVNDGRETYKHQLGLAYLHLISFSQGATAEGYREYLDSALAIFEELNNEEELALAYHQSGLMYCRLQNDHLALKEFQKAKKGLEALGLNKELVFTLQQIEFCRMRLGKITPSMALENSRKQFSEQIECNELDPHEKALFIANKLSYEVTLIQGKELSAKEALQAFEATLKKLPGESVRELTYFLADAMESSKSRSYNDICQRFLDKAKAEASKRQLSVISAPTVIDRMTTAATVLRALSMPTQMAGLPAPNKSSDKVQDLQRIRSELTMDQALMAVQRSAATNFSPFASFLVSGGLGAINNRTNKKSAAVMSRLTSEVDTQHESGRSSEQKANSKTRSLL